MKEKMDLLLAVSDTSGPEYEYKLFHHKVIFDNLLTTFYQF